MLGLRISWLGARPVWPGDYGGVVGERGTDRRRRGTWRYRFDQSLDSFDLVICWSGCDRRRKTVICFVKSFSRQSGCEAICGLTLSQWSSEIGSYWKKPMTT